MATALWSFDPIRPGPGTTVFLVPASTIVKNDLVTKYPYLQYIIIPINFLSYTV